MNFSYERYMNLVWHLDHHNEIVPLDIAKRIISHAIAPVITITSSTALDNHVMENYNIDSLYKLLKYFGGCTSDKDQCNEDLTNNKPQTLPVPNRRLRSNSNSLLQRDPTQLQYIRFAPQLPDLILNQSNIDHESIEDYLKKYLNLINPLVNDLKNHQLLRKSIYHNFFAQSISSTSSLSPFESFNHPILSLLAIDFTKGENYVEARDLLTTFKNLNKFMDDFPKFINISDILPVFLICYNADSQAEHEECLELQKKIKKQLFTESILLPLWRDDNISKNDHNLITLHQPIMSSIHEIISNFDKPIVNNDKLPLTLIDRIYEMIDDMVGNYLIPFMQRKIAFWDENILQPRKSIFHNSNFFKKIINRNNSDQIPQFYIDEIGHKQFLVSSNEFLLRKLADWSLMISDYKTAYLTYTSLINDLNDFPLYLASSLEWCAVSLLMGAQSIVTAKMIKNDITPLIEKSALIYQSEEKLIYESRCMILCTELFLSLNDSWTSTPYAINYLETILSNGKLGDCSEILIWERLSDCYESRIDPRIKHRLETTVPDEHTEIISKGFTRKRKAGLFRLIAAKKWSEQKYWIQVNWCLNDIKPIYSRVGLYDAKGSFLDNIKQQLYFNSGDELLIIHNEEKTTDEKLDNDIYIKEESDISLAKLDEASKELENPSLTKNIKDKKSSDSEDGNANVDNNKDNLTADDNKTEHTNIDKTNNDNDAEVCASDRESNNYDDVTDK